MGSWCIPLSMTVPGKSGVDEVNVDAKTGKVVGVEHESPENEAKEQGQAQARVALIESLCAYWWSRTRWRLRISSRGRCAREAGRWTSLPRGDVALDHLAITEYDIAVVDVGLPDIDGMEVCRRLRARGGRTPILMLTAHGGIADRVRGLDAGADDYLAKPFAIEELLARLRALSRRPDRAAAGPAAGG